MIHTVKCFSVVNKAEVDVFLELSCFFYDPVDVVNLISGSSLFSKSSLIIWKFLVHVLLKPGLKNFEHYFTSTWDECNCAVVWKFFDIAFLWVNLVNERKLLLYFIAYCWYGFIIHFQSFFMNYLFTSFAQFITGHHSCFLFWKSLFIYTCYRFFVLFLVSLLNP